MNGQSRDTGNHWSEGTERRQATQKRKTETYARLSTRVHQVVRETQVAPISHMTISYSHQNSLHVFYARKDGNFRTIERYFYVIFISPY